MEKAIDHGDTAGTARGKNLLTTTNTTGTTRNEIFAFRRARRVAVVNQRF
jgi:hypothetical protein